MDHQALALYGINFRSNELTVQKGVATWLYVAEPTRSGRSGHYGDPTARTESTLNVR
jgi:hypothetical protein